MLDREDDARAEFERPLEISRAQEHPTIPPGRVFMGRSVEAIFASEEDLKANPRNRHALLGIATSYDLVRNPKAALDAYERYLGLAPYHLGALARAEALARTLGKTARADEPRERMRAAALRAGSGEP